MIGDILGAAVLNVDELIEMPMGCGEQNVARLFPNVLIYDYLSRFKAGLHGQLSRQGSSLENGSDGFHFLITKS